MLIHFLISIFIIHEYEVDPLEILLKLIFLFQIKLIFIFIVLIERLYFGILKFSLQVEKSFHLKHLCLCHYLYFLVQLQFFIKFLFCFSLKNFPLCIFYIQHLNF